MKAWTNSGAYPWLCWSDSQAKAPGPHLLDQQFVALSGAGFSLLVSTVRTLHTEGLPYGGYIMTIMKSRLLAATLLLSPAIYAADEDIKKTIQALYASARAAIKEATTKEDIATAGETMTRADAIGGLDALLAIAPEKRPVPTLDFLYVHETGWNILAVYWVYREADQKNHRVPGPRHLGADSARTEAYSA